MPWLQSTSWRQAGELQAEPAVGKDALLPGNDAGQGGLEGGLQLLRPRLRNLKCPAAYAGWCSMHTGLPAHFFGAA